MGGFVKNLTKGIGKAASSVLGLEQPQSPAALSTPPAVEAPKPMPAPNDEAAMAAKRRSTAEQRKRQGRASTVYTAANNDGLGG